MSTDRYLVFAAGLAGAAGVALSAAAAHAGGTHVGTAANFLLFHAAALLAIGTRSPGRLGTAGGWLLLVGLLSFSGDLLALDALGHGLFPYAAPLGGFVMIAGWLLIAVSAFSSARD